MAAQQLGERFARSVAARDADALKSMLAPAVSFRAITPARVWESHDAGAVVDDMILGTWFAPDRHVTQVLAIECADVGPVHHVRYRFGATLPDGNFLIEQQAYLTSDGDVITRLHILCSGYVRE